MSLNIPADSHRIGAMVFVLALAACGGGGGGGSANSPSTAPAQTIISGAVTAPAGQVALSPSRSWLDRVAAMLSPAAYAGISGLVSVPDGTSVQLGKIASDGTFAAIETSNTSGGRYSFNLSRAGLVFTNDLIVQVAHPTNGVRMRAFVIGTNVDVNPSSESAVQEVLDLIAVTPGATLDNFTLEEVRDVVGAIDALTESTQMSTGPNVNTTVTTIRNAVTSDPDISAFFLAASTFGQTAEGPGDVGNFVPMVEGNIWTFQGTEQTAGQAPVSYTNTARTLGTTMVGGVTVQIREESNSLNNGGPSEEYYAKSSRGMTYHGSNDPGDTLSSQLVPYLALRFPLGAGSAFEEINNTNLDYGEDLDGDFINERLELVSTVSFQGYETVTVPAGSYPNCAIVERRAVFTVVASRTGLKVSVVATETAWWASGVGLIKRVARIGDITAREELVSFVETEFTVLSLPGVSDLVFDPVSQRIYASAIGNPGTVTPIDPVTESAGAAIPVGIDPVKLARSDDGAYLYIGLDGQPSVQRIDLSGQAVDLTFLLGDDPNFGPYFVEDMEVLPGIPNSVAISRKRKGVSAKHGGVAIYDDGVQRATTTPDHTGSNVIEFSASAATLYGYNNEDTEFGFRTMAVDASGVTVTDVFTSFMGDLISGFGVDILFHAGSIYTTSGREIDPVARTVLGTFSLPSAFGNLVAADAAIGRVFYLSSWGGDVIRAFDMTTRQEVGSVAIQGANGNPTSLIRWGAKGLAFATSGGQIFLVESSQLIP